MNIDYIREHLQSNIQYTVNNIRIFEYIPVILIQGHKDTVEYKDTIIQRYWDTRIQRYTGLKMQGYRYTKILGYKDR